MTLVISYSTVLNIELSTAPLRTLKRSARPGRNIFSKKGLIAPRRFQDIRGCLQVGYIHICSRLMLTPSPSSGRARNLEESIHCMSPPVHVYRCRGLDQLSRTALTIVKHIFSATHVLAFLKRKLENYSEEKTSVCRVVSIRLIPPYLLSVVAIRSPERGDGSVSAVGWEVRVFPISRRNVCVGSGDCLRGRLMCARTIDVEADASTLVSLEKAHRRLCIAPDFLVSSR